MSRGRKTGLAEWHPEAKKKHGYGVSVTRKYKVLFLCRDNAARSIIAEALLRELAGHRFDAFSAGPEPAARVHPHASAQLRPGISDHGVLCPKSWLEFTGEWAPRMDLVIAMDASVDKNHAPVFPGEPAFRIWTSQSGPAYSARCSGRSCGRSVALSSRLNWLCSTRRLRFFALK
jgi:arsenate reductase